MRRRPILGLTVLALVFAISACGDDGGGLFEGSTTTTAGSTTTTVGSTTTTAGSTTTAGVTTTSGSGSSALAGLVSSALAAGAGTDTSTTSGGEEQCITTGLADAIGAARFAELDAIASSATDMSVVFAQMTDAELSALVDVILACVDVEAMVTAEMAAADFSPDAAACFAESISEGDTLKSLIRAMMTGEDPTTNPEFIAIMLQIMTQDCADALEAMLIEQFVASGASAESAACIADAFMQGGLFEAVLNSMVSGGDPTTDPEFAAQLEQVFATCMPPGG
jgi:hypothetical protein